MRVLVLAVGLAIGIEAVKKQDFRTCAQTFCKWLRTDGEGKMLAGDARTSLVGLPRVDEGGRLVMRVAHRTEPPPQSNTTHAAHPEGDAAHAQTDAGGQDDAGSQGDVGGQGDAGGEASEAELDVVVAAYSDGIVRLRIQPASPGFDGSPGAAAGRRYEVEDVLIDNKLAHLPALRFRPASDNHGGVYRFQLGDYSVRINGHAFELAIHAASDDRPLVSINTNNLLRFHSSAAISLDATFHDTHHLYGIPEHADRFALHSTGVNVEGEYAEPYRLYNLDVFEYILDTTMALYGSIPYLQSHSMFHSLGFFWMNAAETWIDVQHSSSPLHDQSSSSSTDHSKKYTRTHWMVESGSLDIFLLLGPSLKHVSKQYAQLTGTTSLPQLSSLAYHQCRWNYNDQKDVSTVHAGFEEQDIPVDFIWLDIEHTDGKKYFTWDKNKFPSPATMQEELRRHGRKMVTIIDPHIKRDDDYRVYKEALDLDLFVKDSAGKTFEGWCWPGSSSWLDYLNPKAREYWAKQYLFSTYEGSTPTLFTWNDMSEPSVFTGPEITMPKDNLHFGGVKHGDVHNIYGMLLHRATYEGHLLRSFKNGDTNLWTGGRSVFDSSETPTHPHRPFVLNRAFFAGTHRYGAIWTGDNMAQWDHLDAATPMLLSISVTGVHFIGADVGGFFYNPSAELLTRWYQAGAWYPFFRGHAHIDTKRREPWLFGEPFTGAIREAVRERYRFLNYWYTLFRHSQLTGTPPMRPLVYEFPQDETVFGMDDEYMVGSALLVKPITKDAQTEVTVYLPGSSPWFHLRSHEQIQPGHKTFPIASITDTVPVFIRSGSVVPTRDRSRRSSTMMHRDPISLLIAFTINSEEATGELYIDDGESFGYMTGEFVHKRFIFKKSERRREWVLSMRDFSSNTTESQELLKWQRPYLGPYSPTFQNDEKKPFNEFIDPFVRIEKIVILTDIDMHLTSFSSLSAADSKNVIKESTADSIKVDEIGSSWRVTIKQPGVGIGVNWDVLFKV